jgi:hypothetical protein
MRSRARFHSMVRASGILLVTFLFAGSAARATTGGLVAGSVVRPAPGPEMFRPVKGAEVRLVNVLSGRTVATTQSDDTGAFSFQSVDPGAYGIEAADKSACDISRTFYVSQGSSTIVQLRFKDNELCSGPVRFASASSRNWR